MTPGKTPAAVRARNRLWNEIWQGRFVRGTECERCGSGSYIDAHHDDYTKPLDVRWLCRSCHRQHHAALKRLTTTTAMVTT